MDDEAGFFAARRIAIVGLGLMGGSLALALRGRVAALLGIDPDPATRRLALERQIVDEAVSSLDDVLPRADVVILAAPVRDIVETIRRLSIQTSPAESKIILDLGSTKREIVAAMELLPPHFDPLGGHPMCGRETSGLAHADPDIYRCATFAFTPLVRTSQQARAFAERLADAIGARPLWLDAPTHDAWTAATSHLPYLLAAALAVVTPAEAVPLVGPGYRSTSRLASASLPVMLDILKTNQQPVLESLRRFRGQLESIETALAQEDFPALAGLLEDAAKNHAALTCLKIEQDKRIVKEHPANLETQR
jgi:prephenate dehydrogenase